MRQIEQIEKRLRRIEDLSQGVEQLSEILSESDTFGKDEIELYAQEYRALAASADKLEMDTFLSGRYDSADAIVSIYAGAGGDDAQDWAQMVLRMILRYAEKSGFRAKVVEKSPGAQAGLKNATLEIKGDYAYGRLHSESGTHRLVRLSPFNSDNLRQTSFVRVEVLPLTEEKTDIVINPSDIRVDTFRSSGAGGQSVNTTDSAVRVTHLPTGTVVTCQNERSQAQNKEYALKILRAKLLQMELEKRRAEQNKLRGENTSAEWGSQIRSYVLHPYKMVKDHRTGYETAQVTQVLDGELEPFVQAYLRRKSSLERKK